MMAIKTLWLVRGLMTMAQQGEIYYIFYYYGNSDAYA